MRSEVLVGHKVMLRDPGAPLTEHFRARKKRDLGDKVDSHYPFLDVRVQTAIAL